MFWVGKYPSNQMYSSLALFSILIVLIELYRNKISFFENTMDKMRVFFEIGG